MADIYWKEDAATTAYATGTNWVGDTAPAADDNIFLQGSTSIVGSDQSGTELDNITVLPTYSGTLGTADTYLQLDQAAANNLRFAGTGASYIDLGTAASALVQVDTTGTVTSGQSGLYLKNNTGAITLMDVQGGTVRLVACLVTTLRVAAGATVYIDAGSTVTTVNNNGTLISDSAALATVNQLNGTATINGSDAYAANVYGGTLVSNTTGTATVTTYGGTLDLSKSGTARSVTLTYNGGTVAGIQNVTLTDTINAPATLSPA